MEHNVNNNHNQHTKSEEVQDIVDRMPTYWTKWIALCLSFFIGIVVLLGCLIHYPDTVDGQISVTASIAPVRLVAQTSGRMHLLVPNKTQLQAGEVIAIIESGASYSDVLWVEEALKKGDQLDTLFPDTLILGEISSAYNTFLLAYLQYNRLQKSDVYKTMYQNIEQQIVTDEEVITNLDKEIQLKTKISSIVENQLQKDSILLAVQGLSLQEYEQQYKTSLTLQEAILQLKNSRSIKQAEINKNRLELQRIAIEEAEVKSKSLSDLLTKKNELINAIKLWKERYLQYAPIEGELEYLGFWRNNFFVQGGQELFTIIPNQNDVVGEVIIPSQGAGKVEIGQVANVKIDNFPYDEYGLIKGEVKSISRITGKLKTDQGEVNTYLVIISFPQGVITNFGRVLPIDFESRGTVEIITKRKRLIERLFDNLQAKSEK